MIIEDVRLSQTLQRQLSKILPISPLVDSRDLKNWLQVPIGIGFFITCDFQASNYSKAGGAE